MRHYNGNQSAGALGLAKLCVALAAAALWGCAQQPQKDATYGVSVPADASAADASASASADGAADSGSAVQVRKDVPLRYVVKKGDTLWGIAHHFLLDPWQWPEIWYVNDKIRNPHLIYPGDVLTLITVNGRPQLVSGENADGSPASNDNVVKLSPSARISDSSSAIPAIPIDAIRDFLNSSRVVTPEEMAKAPYLVAWLDPQLLGGAGSEGYVKGWKKGGPTQFNVVRMGNKPYTDPETGEILGYEAIPVGAMELTDTSHDIVTGVLTRSSREALAGDRLLPLEDETVQAYFYPKMPNKPIKARIIAELDGVSQVTQWQVVTLNRGSNAGLERGDVLTIKQAGRMARDPVSASSTRQVELPDLEAGTLMVFKVSPKISYGLVVRSTRAIHNFDKAENPTP